MSIGSSSALSSNIIARSVQASGARIGNVRDLPGTEERAWSIIASAQSEAGPAQVDVQAARRNNLQLYTQGVTRAQETVQQLTSTIEKLPEDTSQQERDHWDQELALARSEITYGQSQVAYYQSMIDKNPSVSGSPRDHSLAFASKLLGLSVEQALKLYSERLSVGSDAPSASDLGATPVTEAEWLAKQTSATTRVDFSA